MKTISSTALAALMTAALGLSAIGPAVAQSAPEAPAAQSQQQQKGEHSFRPGNNGPRQNGGQFLNFERGAEAVEVALVRLGHRLDLSEDQKALLETLKTDALAAAETLQTATADLRPAPAAEGEAAVRPDLAQRFDARIALETARLDALESLQPSLTAFLDSLTDEQKAELVPQGGDRAGHPRFGDRNQGPGHGDNQRPNGPRPGAPAPTNNG